MQTSNLTEKLFGHKGLRGFLLAVACLTFVTTFGVATVPAQDPDNPNVEIPIANAQLRAFAALEVGEGAEHFNIEAQTNNLVVLSRDDLVSISANLANVHQLGLAQLRHGANVGFIFLHSTRPNPFLATSFYIARVFAFQSGSGHGNDHDRNSNSEDSLRALVLLVNEQGNTVAVLPGKVTVGRPFVAKSAVPVHSLTLGTNSLGVDVRWNTSNGKSLSVSYSIPLDR